MTTVIGSSSRLDLVESPDLRRRLGQAGQARARAVYDWPHVYCQYQALWADLNARRAAVANNPDDLAWAAAAPRAAPSRLDPFQSFGHYPTAQITPRTQAALTPGLTLETYRARIADPLFPRTDIPESVVLAVWAELARGPATVAALATPAGLTEGWTMVVVGTLAKMGLLRLG